MSDDTAYPQHPEECGKCGESWGCYCRYGNNDFSKWECYKMRAKKFFWWALDGVTKRQ